MHVPHPLNEPASSPHSERLALYHYDGCFFCTIVHRAIAELGIEVELRNIYQDRQHLSDLTAARGRRTVPVLRISRADGSEVWMPESRDIVRYLRQRGT